MKLLKDETSVPTTWAEVAITDNLITSDDTAPTTAETSLCRKFDITSGKLSTEATTVYTCLECIDGYTLNPDYDNTLTTLPTVLPCVDDKLFKGYFEDSITSTILPI